jgi:hypothetical protein
MRTLLIATGAMAFLGCTIDNRTTAPGTAVTITWSPCINDIDGPTWMAIKDGDGPWTRIIQANGVYTFAVKSGKVGMATYANGDLTINYTTTAEADSSKPTCVGARRDVTGTVTGYSSLDDINIQAELGSAFVSGTAAAPAGFTISDVTPDQFDVLAVRSRSTTTGSVFTTTPTSVFIRRAQSASPLAVIDLNGTEAGPPLSKTLTIANAASNDEIDVFSSLNTAKTAIFMSTYATTLTGVTGTVSAPFYGLASTRLVAGEVQTIDLIASSATSSTTTNTRSAAVTFTDIADKTATLGPALGTVNVSGSARPSATYVIQPGYDQTFQVSYSQGTGVSSKFIDVSMTRGYAGNTATQVTLDIPDLSGLNGFQSTWLLSVGATAHYSFNAAGAAYSIFQRNDQTYIAASRTSTFIP